MARIALGAVGKQQAVNLILCIAAIGKSIGIDTGTDRLHLIQTAGGTAVPVGVMLIGTVDSSPCVDIDIFPVIGLDEIYRSGSESTDRTG